MSNARLVLYPKEPLLELPLEPLVSLLQQQQIAAEPLSAEHGVQHYLVGERFFEAFLFLGCSPSIELSPTHDGVPFCHLQLELDAHCSVVSGKNLKAACKQCKQRYGMLGPLQSESVPKVICPHCGAVQCADDVAWRKSAAVSRVRISLWNIFEGEAVPSDLLLGLLQRESGVAWAYAYVS